MVLPNLKDQNTRSSFELALLGLKKLESSLNSDKRNRIFDILTKKEQMAIKKLFKAHDLVKEERRNKK